MAIKQLCFIGHKTLSYRDVFMRVAVSHESMPSEYSLAEIVLGYDKHWDEKLL
ncbi:MAG: hypothetical protein K0S11_396 [Gammaproteobacteria bacterium]|jgi:hypothetical protein|nr:hypothetical protein [Gammaproteobacteria bacterium]